MPRDIDPAAGKLDGVYLYDLEFAAEYRETNSDNPQTRIRKMLSADRTSCAGLSATDFQPRASTARRYPAVKAEIGLSLGLC